MPIQLVDLDNTITNTSHNANKNLWDIMSHDITSQAKTILAISTFSRRTFKNMTKLRTLLGRDRPAAVKGVIKRIERHLRAITARITPSAKAICNISTMQ